MSKTVSTCILETNQVLNQPQENIFFHTIYRTQQDYPNEFLRTARSTSPIQICAIFSCIGPDNLGAVLNIELNEELSKIVASCQNQPVLDFEAFSNQVINVLNVKVCGFSVSRGGTSLKVSMTMIVIEGDTLRVIHIGNTKAVLVRENKIMALTEDHTVAHNYVKMNAITPEQEKTHPDNMNLTQYLGKMPQEGPIVADKKVRVKLQNNDEICLMGLGVSRLMPAQTRNVILVKPTSTENKAREIINSAFNYGVKSGLSVCLVQIESTFLLPGDATLKSNLASDASVAVAPEKKVEKAYTPLNEPTGDVDEDFAETQKFSADANSDDEEPKMKSADKKKDKKKKNVKLWDILVPVITLLVCCGIGYGGMYLVFNAKHLLDKVAPKITEESQPESVVMYALNDNTPIYSDASLDSSTIGILARGQSVACSEQVGDFMAIQYEGATAYVLAVQLSDVDPTIGEDIPEIVDPTPVPTESTAAETEATTEATTEASTQASTQATAAPSTQATTEATTVTEATTEAPTEPAPTEAPTESAPDNGGDTPAEGGEDTPADNGGETPAEEGNV